MHYETIKSPLKKKPPDSIKGSCHARYEMQRLPHDKACDVFVPLKLVLLFHSIRIKKSYIFRKKNGNE
jgi:hypothetical protein